MPVRHLLPLVCFASRPSIPGAAVPWLHSSTRARGSQPSPYYDRVSELRTPRSDGSDPRPSLAVCVVTYERPEYLRRCVASLTTSEDQIDEIIVVDASTESDGEAFGRRFPALRYVHAPQLAGWMTRSRNEALRWVHS